MAIKKLEIKGRNKYGKYTIGENQYLSVTTYIDRVFGIEPGIVQHYHCKHGWEKAQILRKEAGDYGTWAHKEIQNYLQDQKQPHPTIMNRVGQIQDYLTANQIKPKHMEIILYSDHLKTAGTCDFIGETQKFKDIQYIITDWKTGSSNPWKELIQIGTYAYMFCEMYDVPLKQCVGAIFHIGKEDTVKIEPKTYSSTQLRKGLQMFKSIQKFYNYKQMMSKSKFKKKRR